jgi:type III pantothenate kinase
MDPNQSEAHYARTIRTLLSAAGLAEADLSGIIISSVVPSLTPIFRNLSTNQFDVDAVIVSPTLDTGLNFSRMPFPQQIGNDRIVNAAYAYAQYRQAVIVLDCGTATTLSVVNGQGEFLGGAIAPGLQTSAAALAQSTAQLPSVPLRCPPQAIGPDTISAIQSGLLYGHAGLIDHLVQRIITELGEPSVVLATGGLSPLLSPLCSTLTATLPQLSLEALGWLYTRASKDKI